MVTGLIRVILRGGTAFHCVAVQLLALSIYAHGNDGGKKSIRVSEADKNTRSQWHSRVNRTPLFICRLRIRRQRREKGQSLFVV